MTPCPQASLPSREFSTTLGHHPILSTSMYHNSKGFCIIAQSKYFIQEKQISMKHPGEESQVLNPRSLYSSSERWQRLAPVPPLSLPGFLKVEAASINRDRTYHVTFPVSLKIKWPGIPHLAKEVTEKDI